MKKLQLLIAAIILLGGCTAKAPSMRFGQMWALCERQNYDLAMTTAGYMYRRDDIGDTAKDYIIEIGEMSNDLYMEVIQDLIDYRKGDVGLYEMESEIRRFHAKQIELNAAIKAFMQMIEGRE